MEAAVPKPPTIRFTQLYIDGRFRDSSTGRSFASVCPFTGEPVAHIQEAGPDDVEEAVRAARRAFQSWSRERPSTRAGLLFRLADLVEENAATLAALDTLENGIAIAEMSITARAAAHILRFYAGAADKTIGETIPEDEHIFSMTVREPLGVCAIIIPWNSPSLMLAKTIGPALAAGNAVIVKPAEQTSLSALLVAHLSGEAGLPPGLINVLPGDGPTVGGRLVEHMDVDHVTFTGSTQVGQGIVAAAARTNLKRVTLELGGKSPLVVFDDVDVKRAARLATAAVFVSNGQVCCAASRTYVHESIYERFVEECAQLARHRRLGNPLLPETEQGPQLDRGAFDKINRFIESGIRQGARLVTGGPATADAPHSGLFVPPTVFADVDESMEIGREEIFGPVQCIMRFGTLDEVVLRANRTRFGLAAGVLTNDIRRAMAFARRVRAGTCWINCYFVVRPETPFGGYHMSGWGREFGQRALDEYQEIKTITMGLRPGPDYMFG